MPAMPVAPTGKVMGFFVRKALARRFLRVGHDFEEARVQMADERRGHRAEDARMGVAWSGAEQQAQSEDSAVREGS